MEQVKRISLSKIKFEYANNVAPDEKIEENMTRNANMWLSPFVDQINNQDGSIVFYIKSEHENRVHFDGMSDDLQGSLYKRMELFLSPKKLLKLTPSL